MYNTYFNWVKIGLLLLDKTDRIKGNVCDLAVIRSYSQLLAGNGRYWKLMTVTGSYWKLSAVIASYQHLSAVIVDYR